MHAKISSVILILGIVPGFVGCGKEKAPKKVISKARHKNVPGDVGPARAPARTGVVLESLAAPPYTYVHVDTGDSKIWVAAPAVEVAVGDSVDLPAQMSPMKNWPSKALDRTFDVLYLAQELTKAGAKSKSGSGPGREIRPSGSATERPGGSLQIDLTGIAKAEGGKTIAEVYSELDSLSGKEVVFRGKVVKANANIMGKNWLHLREGTGDAKTNDLTVTTSESLPKLGDTVVVKGKVTLNKDFGAGYKYAVIIEEASILKE
jgi:hypothetical protein